jgi:hypothetical protein
MLPSLCPSPSLLYVRFFCSMWISDHLFMLRVDRWTTSSTRWDRSRREFRKKSAKRRTDATVVRSGVISASTADRERDQIDRCQATGTGTATFKGDRHEVNRATRRSWRLPATFGQGIYDIEDTAWFEVAGVSEGTRGHTCEEYVFAGTSWLWIPSPVELRAGERGENEATVEAASATARLDPSSFDCLVRRRKSYCANPSRKKWFVTSKLIIAPESSIGGLPGLTRSSIEKWPVLNFRHQYLQTSTETACPLRTRPNSVWTVLYFLPSIKRNFITYLCSVWSILIL